MAPEQVLPSDLQLFHDAQAALQAAQGVVQFVSNHLSKVYGLAPDTKVDLRPGVITRGETEIPAGG